MANKTEDRLISGWASDEKRTLLDLATGGRAKTSEDLPSLLDVAKRAYGSLQAAGARQQEELNRPIIASVGGRDIDLGVSKSDIFGYITAGTLGKGATFAKTDVFKVNPSQAKSVLKALPGKGKDNLEKLLENPGKLISEVTKKLKNKYRPEFILQVIRQHYRDLIGSSKAQRGTTRYTREGHRYTEPYIKPRPKSLREKGQGTRTRRSPDWIEELEKVGD